MLRPDFSYDYNEFTIDVTNSSYKTFIDNLNRWFDFLFESPSVRETLRALEAKSDFDAWYAAQEGASGSFIGSADIKWPRDKSVRLGTQLMLFRKFAEEVIDVMHFASTFTHAENSSDQMASVVALQYFRPFASDLLRYLKSKEDSPSSPKSESGGIPASDRVVSLRHNTPEYCEAIGALDDLKTAAIGSNSYPDTEVRSQRLGELAAATELLKATQARLRALAVVVGGVVLWFLKKFAGEAVGKFAGIVLDKLEALLGSDWLSF